MSLILRSSASALTVVPLDDAKEHLRVDYSDEDPLITSLIESAVEWVEEYCAQDFREREWRMERKDTFYSLIFPRGPVKSVEQVGTREDIFEPDTIALIAPTEYVLLPETRTKAAALYFRHDAWSALPPPDGERGVIVDFTTGWDPVPAPVKSACLLHISTLFHAREDQILTTNAMPSQLGIERLLAMYRVPHYR